MKIVEIEALLYRTYLNALSTYRFVQTTEFSIAFDNANEDEKDSLYEIVQSTDKERIITWVRNVLARTQNYVYLDIRTLRNLCVSRDLKYYGSSDRFRLIQILEYQDKQNKQHENKSPNSDRVQESPQPVLDESPKAKHVDSCDSGIKT